jgi:hypothetical protein
MTALSSRAPWVHFDDEHATLAPWLPPSRSLSTARRSQFARSMAAVLCLMFLPLSFGVLFMIGSVGGQLSVGTVLAVLTFVLLGAGLVIGAIRMSRDWDVDHE